MPENIQYTTAWWTMKLSSIRTDKIPGGKGDTLQPRDVNEQELAKGIKVEREHTDSDELAREIALDHLAEDPAYYTKLEKVHKEFRDPPKDLMYWGENPNEYAEVLLPQRELLPQRDIDIEDEQEFEKALAQADPNDDELPDSPYQLLGLKEPSEPKPEPQSEIPGIHPILLASLKHIDPSSMLSMTCPKLPFIYWINPTTNQPQLLMGRNDDDYHSYIVSDLKDTDPLAYKILYEIQESWDPSEYEVAFGRVAYDYSLHRYNPETTKTVSQDFPRLASIYAGYMGAKPPTPELIQGTVKELLKEKQLYPDSPVIYAKNVKLASDWLQNANVEISEKEKRRGELQVMLHLGRDKFGQPLTPQQRRRIAKELGREGDEELPDRRNPWAREMQNKNLLKPGQKWWAPTSENYIKKLNKI